MRHRIGVSVALILAIGAAGLAIGACKQQRGDRCEVEADCADGLTCNHGKDPPECDDQASNMPIDAMPPPDAPADAPSD